MFSSQLLHGRSPYFSRLSEIGKETKKQLDHCFVSYFTVSKQEIWKIKQLFRNSLFSPKIRGWRNFNLDFFSCRNSCFIRKAYTSANIYIFELRALLGKSLKNLAIGNSWTHFDAIYMIKNARNNCRNYSDKITSLEPGTAFRWKPILISGTILTTLVFKV